MRALAGYSNLHKDLDRRNFYHCIRIDFKEAFAMPETEGWLLSHLTAMILVNKFKFQ